MTPGGLASEAEAEGAAAWRERSVERSLREHRARALTRSDQFLRAARTLLSETGGVDFTVQEVVTPRRPLAPVLLPALRQQGRAHARPL